MWYLVGAIAGFIGWYLLFRKLDRLCAEAEREHEPWL